MQQALKKIWSEELKGHLQSLSVRSKDSELAPTPGENIVRPSFSRTETAPPLREKPEFAAALEAVLRAVDLIRSAEERAQLAEEQSIDIAQRALAEHEANEARIKTANEAIVRAEERANAAAQRAAEQLTSAEAKAAVANQRIKELESHLVSFSDKMTRTERLIADAHDRVFAAETRAIEAREDVEYLQSFIKDQLGSCVDAATDTSDDNEPELRGVVTA